MNYYNILILLLLLLSCRKTENYCELKIPVTDVAWIKNVIKTSPHNLKIYELTYKSTDGIFIYSCLNQGCTIASSNFRTCDNTLLYQSLTGQQSSFPSDFGTLTTRKKLIYSK